MRCWVMGGGVHRGNWEGGKVKEGLLGNWEAESWREQEHLEINDLHIKGFHSEEIVFHSSTFPFTSTYHNIWSKSESSLHRFVLSSCLRTFH